MTELAELELTIGKLNVEDPDSVYLSAVPTDAIDLPPGMKDVRAWRYRFYIPANYGTCRIGFRGYISADSPRFEGDWRGGFSAAKAAESEGYLTIAMIKTSDDQILLCSSMDGMSSESKLDEFDSNVDFDSLIVDTPFDAELQIGINL